MQTAVLFGLLEWIFAAQLGFAAFQRDSARTIVAILAMYGGLGAVLGRLLAAHPWARLGTATVVGGVTARG